mmetsp:Transcript_4497/g.10972  ORF Transcript_4497/g.10972 Transcript_4497/m.10972 type:complete len:101 (-) Transcript_4497:1585-1887(-)
MRVDPAAGRSLCKALAGFLGIQILSAQAVDIKVGIHSEIEGIDELRDVVIRKPVEQDAFTRWVTSKYSRFFVSNLQFFSSDVQSAADSVFFGLQLLFVSG